jgi:hypothetical protein
MTTNRIRQMFRCDILTDDIIVSIKDKARVTLARADDFISRMPESRIKNEEFEEFLLQVQALRISLDARLKLEDYIENVDEYLNTDEELRKNLIPVVDYFCEPGPAKPEKVLCSDLSSPTLDALVLAEKRLGTDFPNLRRATRGIDNLLMDACDNSEFHQVEVIENINHQLALFMGSLPITVNPAPAPVSSAAAIAASSSAATVVVMATILTINHYTAGFNKLTNWCANNLRFFKQPHNNTEMATDEERNNLIQLSVMQH